MGSAGAQNGTQNRASDSKWLPKNSDVAPKERSWNRVASRIALGAFLAPILVDFGWNFDEILKILVSFSEISCRTFCRSLNGEQPHRTIKNCREPSEISTAKLHCRNLAFCKMPATATNACTKTPSYKMGGGGARAAWRIRIRRPPPSWRVGHGVSDQTPYFCRPLPDSRPPRAPPPTPTPPKVAGCFTVGRPMSELLSFLVDFRLPQKS